MTIRGIPPLTPLLLHTQNVGKARRFQLRLPHGFIHRTMLPVVFKQPSPIQQAENQIQPL